MVGWFILPTIHKLFLLSSYRGTLKLIEAPCAVEPGSIIWRLLLLVFKYVSYYSLSNFLIIMIFGAFHLELQENISLTWKSILKKDQKSEYSCIFKTQNWRQIKVLYFYYLKSHFYLMPFSGFCVLDSWFVKDYSWQCQLSMWTTKQLQCISFNSECLTLIPERKPNSWCGLEWGEFIPYYLQIKHTCVWWLVKGTGLCCLCHLLQKYKHTGSIIPVAME